MMTPTDIQSLIGKLKSSLEKATDQQIFEAVRQPFEAVQARLNEQGKPFAPAIQLL
ncbi:MAG: hypothetical protein AAFU71_15550 [Cyanobacteria bacterium J06632_22]